MSTAHMRHPLTTSEPDGLGPRLDAIGPGTASYRGQTYDLFAGCNYLGLAQHPDVIAAARNAFDAFGLSTSASRTTTGQTQFHRALEQDAAKLTGVDDAVLVPEGLTANIAAAQALAAIGVQHALIDERAHASLTDAARCAGLQISRYRHRSPEHAATLAAATGGPVAVLTDAVFTATGAVAPLAELLAALPPDAWLLADDCHGFGVLGDSGAGTPAYLGVTDHRLIHTTTLAKAIGCAGGLVLACDHIVRTLRARATAFICTTPPPTPMVAAARAAIALAADPALRLRLHSNLDHLDRGLAALSIQTLQTAEPRSRPVPIRTMPLPTSRTPEAAHAMLLQAGILTPPSTYPGGPATPYLRLAISSVHQPHQLERLLEALRSVFQ